MVFNISKSGPKYGLKTFNFKEFKGIFGIEINDLPKGASWIFLTGENGFGKSTVLQAIATSLVGVEQHTFTLFNNERDFSLETQLHGTSKSFQVSPINPIGPSDNRFKFLCCYGSSRLETLTETNLKTNNLLGVTQSLYDSRTYLENIEYQFTRWQARQDNKDSREKYNYTKQLLIELLEIEDILVEFDSNSEQVKYIEKDDDDNKYSRVPLDGLASGYKSLVVMVGDMILKLFRTQPEINDPSKIEGIVIIDELDLHFHPKWQKRLPGILAKLFPKVQFVASTHSPIPLLGAPKNSVILRVDRSVNTGITVTRIDDKIYLEELLPNTILTSPIFGMEDITNDSRESGSMVRTESTFADLNFSDQLESKIQSFMTNEKEQDLINRFKKKRS